MTPSELLCLWLISLQVRKCRTRLNLSLTESCLQLVVGHTVMSTKLKLCNLIFQVYKVTQFDLNLLKRYLNYLVWCSLLSDRFLFKTRNIFGNHTKSNIDLS